MARKRKSGLHRLVAVAGELVDRPVETKAEARRIIADELVYRLRDEQTYQQIAKDLGVSRQTVHMWVRLYTRRHTTVDAAC